MKSSIVKFTALLILLSIAKAHALTPYLELNAGTALQTENLQPNGIFELRAGTQLTPNLAISMGYLNDAERELNASPDRLLPGEASLRTPDIGLHFMVPMKRVTFITSLHGGYTFADNVVSKNMIGLGDLQQYRPEEEFISASERIRNGLSARITGRLEYAVTRIVSVGITGGYFFFETERERHVTTYDEDSPLPYNDRYYRYDTVNEINLGYWLVMVGAKVKLF